MIDGADSGVTGETQRRSVKRFRVWLALVGMPLILAASFLALALYLMLVNGLAAEDVARALEGQPAVPASAGFAAAFFLTRWLAAKDGLRLSGLGWTRPTFTDVLLGLGAAAVLGTLNAHLLYPLVQAAQPSFDPTLSRLSLPSAVVLMCLAVAAEDTLYRGYALVELQRRYGTVASVAITTTCYALLTPAQGLPLMAWAAYFGVVLCGLRLWRRSLWPGAIAHGLVALGPKLLAP